MVEKYSGIVKGGEIKASDMEAALDSKQDATTAVRTTGDQTIAGTKTFSANPMLASPGKNNLPGTGGTTATTIATEAQIRTAYDALVSIVSNL